MAFYLTDIEKKTLDNTKFRRVLFTSPHAQLVVMALKPGEDIGLETHEDVDQFIRVEAGHGTASLDGKEHALQDGSAVVIPAGTKHNIINSSRTEMLKLYTIYSPPEHPDGTSHETRAEAETSEREHRRRVAAERRAIERWESEGGRALPPEEDLLRATGAPS